EQMWVRRSAAWDADEDSSEPESLLVDAEPVGPDRRDARSRTTGWAMGCRPAVELLCVLGAKALQRPVERVLRHVEAQFAVEELRHGASGLAREFGRDPSIDQWPAWRRSRQLSRSHAVISALRLHRRFPARSRLPAADVGSVRRSCESAIAEITASETIPL